jgi:hypothetical protein
MHPDVHDPIHFYIMKFPIFCKYHGFCDKLKISAVKSKKSTQNIYIIKGNVKNQWHCKRCIAYSIDHKNLGETRYVT